MVTVTAYSVYTTVYSELTACNPNLTGDCSTATKRRNNEYISHRPSSKVACIANSGVC